MIRFLIIVLIVLLPAPQGVLGQSALSSTRMTVEKWVETKQLISRLDADWKAEQEVLQQAIAAFQRELKSLGDQVGGVEKSGSQVSEELSVFKKEKEAFLRSSDYVKSEISRLEGRIQKLVPLLPSVLTEKLDTILDRIPKDASTTKISMSTRMQTILGILNEIEKFNGSLSVVSELRENTAGEKIQTRVLYLGLAQAYFVNPSGSFAGKGIPSSNGWKWTQQVELASTIQNAIEIYDGSKTAEFLLLPIQID